MFRTVPAANCCSPRRWWGGSTWTPRWWRRTSCRGGCCSPRWCPRPSWPPWHGRRPGSGSTSASRSASPSRARSSSGENSPNTERIYRVWRLVPGVLMLSELCPCLCSHTGQLPGSSKGHHCRARASSPRVLVAGPAPAPGVPPPSDLCTQQRPSLLLVTPASCPHTGMYCGPLSPVTCHRDYRNISTISTYSKA